MNRFIKKLADRNRHKDERDKRWKEIAEQRLDLRGDINDMAQQIRERNLDKMTGETVTQLDDGTMIIGGDRNIVSMTRDGIKVESPDGSVVVQSGGRGSISVVSQGGRTTVSRNPRNRRRGTGSTGPK